MLRFEKFIPCRSWSLRQERFGVHYHYQNGTLSTAFAMHIVLGNVVSVTTTISPPPAASSDSTTTNLTTILTQL